MFVRVVGAGALAAVYQWARSGSVGWLLPIPVLLACAFLSGSRGGLLAVGIAGLGFGLYACCIASRRLMAFLVFGAAVAIPMATPLGDRVIEFWQYRVVQGTVTDQHLADRDTLFLEAWQLYLENPIRGRGLDSFHTLTSSVDPYPHNLLLTFAAEGGLIGVIFFLTFLCASGASWLQRQTLESVTAFWFGMMYLIAGMFSGGFYDARFMWVFLLIFVLPRSDSHGSRDLP